jgi:hypothetical protein
VAISIEKLFNSLETGAVWDTGVTFNRTNAIPIDKFSVFQSYELANQYAQNSPIAYPGQLIAVVPSSGEVSGYIVSSAGTLTALAVGADLEEISERIAALVADLQNTIIAVANSGSVVTVTKANGTTSSFNTTFIGTRAEYESAYAAGKIPVGTIVVITDEDDTEQENADLTSSLLGTGVLGHMILG